ncbi:hypothetical protein RIEGSTA812A_PEG_130 [invertebrate metagenome]|uniref:Uncharacterized protein n=1 Tax=invertebrate metagenome TaxID=1711999 RepID=A0A484H4N0_9ZZZZ
MSRRSVRELSQLQDAPQQGHMMILMMDDVDTPSEVLKERASCLVMALPAALDVKGTCRHESGS